MTCTTRKLRFSSQRTLETALVVAVALIAVACGDYGGGGGSATVGGGGGGGGGTSLSFSGGADSVSAFSQTVYPIARSRCAECHAGEGPGSPSFAHPDLATAYDAVTFNQKVNFNNPSASRLVRRLAADFHYCWSGCVENGAEMNAAVTVWADAINVEGGGTVVEEAILSRDLSLGDGVEAEGEERYAGGLIALWEFKEGERGFAYDTSGVEPVINLSLGDIRWMSSYGIEFDGERSWGTATRAQSRKVYDHIAAPDGGTQQFSIEAWVVPANVTQSGPTRIISYSLNREERNFTLAQQLYSYDFRNRSVDGTVDENGLPSLETSQDDQDVHASLQHVVVTYDQYRGRRIYVNGAFTDDLDEVAPERLWNWSADYNMVVGNEMSRDRGFEGQLRLAAIYEYALSDAQILQNYRAGVGKRLLLRFDISEWGAEGAFLEFIVSELDEYSYLFCEPTVVSPEVGFRVSNLRIVVNGQIPISGQAFVNVDATIVDTEQRLSRQCSIIWKDAGPDFDVFTVDFEYLGLFENPIVVEIFDPPPPGDFGDPMPIEGLRDFERIGATMTAVTGVNFHDPNISVKQTFLELKQQLPSGSDIRTFSSSQQIGISKLALEYCDALVEVDAYRDAFFEGGLSFITDPETLFAVPGNRLFLADRLHERMIGTGIETLPSQQEVRDVVDGLIDDLLLVCTTEVCDETRTRTIVKGACAAVLASAGGTIH